MCLFQHFVGGNGPTNDYPDPVSADGSIPELQENHRKKDRFKILLTELRHLVIKGKESRKVRKKCMEAKFMFFLQNTLIVSDHSCY